MILKRFLKLSLITRPNPPTLLQSCYLLSTGKDPITSTKDQQPVAEVPVEQQQGQEVAAEQVEVEEGVKAVGGGGGKGKKSAFGSKFHGGKKRGNDGESSEQVNAGEEVGEQADDNASVNTSSRNEGRRKGNFDKSKSFRRDFQRQQEDDYKIIVDQFLRPRQKQQQQSVKMKRMIQQIGQVKSRQEFQAKVQQFLKNQQKKKLAPLQAYEKKLNIWPENLIRNKTLLNEQSAYFIKGFDYSKLKNDTLLRMTVNQVKNLYLDGIYENFEDKTFAADLIKHVQASKNKSFLLNLLYSTVSRSQRVSNIVVASTELLRIIQNLSAPEYQETNPLKFLYFTIKIQPAMTTQCAPHMVKQLNKLTINGQKVNKDLKSLTYFYFTEQLSSKIVIKVLKNAATLEEAIHLWFLTVMVMSRLRDLERDGYLGQGGKVNFNDIFNLNKKDQYSQYFLTDLPQILYEEGTGVKYQIYRKALQNYYDNNKNIKGINFSTFQQKYRLSLLTIHNNNISASGQGQQNQQVKIAYAHQHDPATLATTLHKRESPAARFNNVDSKIVENIVKQKYEKALEYYYKNIAHSKTEKQQVHKFLHEARSKFYDDRSQALFVLKEVFKNSKYTLDEDCFTLTEKEVEEFNTKKGKGEISGSSFVQEDRRLQKSDKDDGGKRAPEPKKFQNKKYQQAQKIGKPIFGKKIINEFSTNKDNIEPPMSQEQSNKQYENYRRAVKQVQELAKKVQQQSKESEAKVSLLNFTNCKNLQEIQQQFQSKLASINETNIKQLIAQHGNIPIVGSLSVLLKYYLLNSSNSGVSSAGEGPKGLNVEFSSTFGQISKDYGQYLKNCAVMFELPDEVYDDLLSDQVKKCQRHHFKRIVAHLFLFKKQIPDQVIRKVCQICSKQKIGLTLLQIINLLNIREAIISYQSLKFIASSIQNFKNMESDLIEFVRKYCDRSHLQMETQLFQPYITSLTFTERYEALNSFLEILRQEFKAKDYKVNNKISAEENIKAEKQYKLKQTERLNKQLFEMVKFASNSLKPRTKIPQFLPQLFDLYMSKKKSPMTDQQYGVGLIVNSQKQDKFLELIKKLKQDPVQNNVLVFNSLIRAMMSFGRNLKEHVQKILGATLFQKQYDLTEEQLKNLGYVFRDLDIPGSYIEYLEFVLKTQPRNTQQIKNLYYKVLNITSDDQSKNQISGLLDFIFNPAKEKDRAEYKLVKIEEEKKSKILKGMGQKKQVKVQENVEAAEVKKEEVQEKKKTKKQLKKQQKKLKGEDDKKTSEKKEKTKNVVKQQKETSLSVKSTQDYRLKREAKQLQKLSSSFNYDQNKKVVYNQRMSKRDLRKQGAILFLDNFMSRFELSNEEDQTGKDRKKGKGASRSEPKAAKKEVKAAKKN